MSDPISGTVIPHFDPKDIEDHRIMATLSYISILFLVPMFGARKSRFAQEHAKQGLLLFIVWIIGSLVFWIPLFGWLAMFAVFCANLIAIVKCLNGEFWEIPVLGYLRSKIKL
jgi:uncharacterized membrane protein